MYKMEGKSLVKNVYLGKQLHPFPTYRTTGVRKIPAWRRLQIKYIKERRVEVFF